MTRLYQIIIALCTVLPPALLANPTAQEQKVMQPTWQSSLKRWLLLQGLEGATLISGLCAAGGLLPYLAAKEKPGRGPQLFRAGYLCNNVLFIILITATNAAKEST